MIRTFIAVQPPGSVRAALAELSADLARRWPSGAVRWVPANNVHLTLRFLGDTDESAVGALGAALDQVVGDQKRFKLSLSKVGAFPDARRPRVIWVGLADPSQQLRPLRAAVEQMAQRLGWGPEEQRFRPHLTLGRVKRGSQPQDAEWLEAGQPHAATGIAFEAGSVELIESRLGSDGAVYSCLHRAHFSD